MHHRREGEEYDLNLSGLGIITHLHKWTDSSLKNKNH